MTALFEYPKNAEFGRIVAKSKIFERVKPNRQLQEAFASQVKKIVWRYKLSPKTINLAETDKLKEIEIFELPLKTSLKKEQFDTKILHCIDKAIGHPIVFHLTHADRIKVVATYKRPSEADANKWVVDNEYFETDWLPEKSVRQNLPVVLNLSGLYETILRELIPLDSRKDESLDAHIERMGQVLAKRREYGKLETRMSKEKQYNRKVEMNAGLRKLQTEIERLKA
ncbi:MAG: DUF4391 domain-containing protein [Thiotrichaceae bacterium]|nr:DUF4391 domain-containing protein [Thiotrichaceae bacterium]